MVFTSSQCLSYLPRVCSRAGIGRSCAASLSVADQIRAGHKRNRVTQLGREEVMQEDTRMRVGKGQRARPGPAGGRVLKKPPKL